MHVIDDLLHALVELCTYKNALPINIMRMIGNSCNSNNESFIDDN